MTKSRDDSEMRVWDSAYINMVKLRAEEDRDLVIEQIERSGYAGDYLVEVYHKKPEGRWRNL